MGRMKKIDRGKAFLVREADRFRCPVCHEGMHFRENGLICPTGHRFDLSKKGTLYFLKRHLESEYTTTMLAHRRRMLQSGLYAPLVEHLAEIIAPEAALLDAGCGEGSFLAALEAAGHSGVKVGFDLSKEGIYLATDLAADAFFCIADMTNLPFQTGSFAAILNILSPSHYQEFKRVLAPDGRLIKVLPGSDYLAELRRGFFQDDRENYSNERVVQKLSAEMKIIEKTHLFYQQQISNELFPDLLAMSPLTWQFSAQEKEQFLKNYSGEITIDLWIYQGVH